MSQESNRGPDAAPQPPRDQHMDDESQPGTHGHAGDDFVNIPNPHQDWEFNVLLIRISDEIVDQNELEKMKSMFYGEIGRGVLERINTARDLFDELRKRGFISRENLLYLQTILMISKRPDLVKIAIEYARKAEKSIHFIPPPVEPMNGYTTLKFHIEGDDFQSWSLAKVDDLRAKVSRMLMVPHQCVIIAGIEPSSSMLITVFVPEMYGGILQSMLEANAPMQPLIDISIDMVHVGGTAYNIRGVDGVELVETEQQRQLVNVFRQLQDKTIQLETMSEATAVLSKEKNKLEKRVSELDMEVTTLRGIFYKADDGPSSLASQSSYELFKQGLQKVISLGYDTAVMSSLLSANVAVVINRIREESKNKISYLQLALKDLQSQVIPLQHQLDIIRLTTNRSLEQMLRDSFVQLVQSVAVSSQQIGQELTEAGQEILKKLSRFLRPKDRQKLEKRYKWNPNDQLTQCKERDTSLFLACIFYKEIELTKALIDFELFVESCLKEVNRSDLLQKFHDILSRQRRMHQQKKSSPQGTKSETTQSPQANEQLSRMELKINSIAEKVTTIDDQIQSAKSYCKPAEGFEKFFPSYPSSKIFPSSMFESFSKPTKVSDYSQEMGSDES